MIDKIIDIKNEFGWCFSVLVSVTVGFSVTWWAVEILNFLQRISRG